uniref:NADH dehydrogenase subunit 5 n=1 Tax=Periclimenes brevicarpalis TaxID=390963 RepID=UPI001FA6CFDA|nr:NADH dehydrogenase subunit 5 [Periclimenes brevicarpalis]UMY76334.1 NADH dehydrogenase subunit 5 [Periclimenes brevicarpalis]
MSWNIKMNLTSMVFLLLCSTSFLVSSLFMLDSGGGYFLEWELFSVNSVSIEMAMIFDWMSLMFLSFVCYISSMVLYYSGGYMSGDWNVNRFMYLVLCFVFSMFLLVVSPNIVSVLLGWDGLGLVSYALVIYYQNEKSSGAGMLTALSNRVGDVAILLVIVMIGSFGGWNYMLYVEVDPNLPDFLNVSMSLLVLAAITKSAQIPFSAWLPAAMAAPTPVSALVHSSTLVTAGVYLLIRFSSVTSSSSAHTCLLFLGCWTMFLAGLTANFETDLKKIIALSTLSQLGVMMSTLAMGFSNLAFFHLLSHAMFKALLFMCAGSVIHSVGGSQDIRTMGGLVWFKPMSVMMMNLANLSLCGFPFLAGFYSKDLILEMAFSSRINEMCFYLYVVATGLTACYSLRLVYYSLSGGYNLSCASSVDDEDVLMSNPMLGLCLGAVMAGSAICWVAFPSPYMICLPMEMKMLPLVVSLGGGVLGYFLNMISLESPLKSLSFYSSSYKDVHFFGSMWYLPFISTEGVGRSVLKIGGQLYLSLDKGWFEYYGGQGCYSALGSGSKLVEFMQNNEVKVYLLMSLVWGLGVIILM